MRLEQSLIAFDQLINTFIGKDGWADESFSSRCWRNRAHPEWNKWRIRVDTLFFWQKDHCKNAYESELSRRHLPVELRQVKTTN